MKKLYYSLCVDVLVQYRSNPKNKGMWKFYSMLYLSLCMGMNWGFIYAFLGSWFNFSFHDKLEINLFPGNRIDYMLSFFVIFMFPPWIINYFLIFYKDRYIELEKKYKYQNGKFFFTYLILSMFIPLFYVLFFM